MFSFSLIWESIAAQFLTFVPVVRFSVSLVGAANTFSELIHPLIKLPNCVLKFYNLSEALGSFGLLPLRGAGTGFVGVLPLPLIFDPPLYILHFTEKQC